MGKKIMSKRTPPKKLAEKTMEDNNKGKGKQPVQKGKEKLKGKVTFADPVVETGESETSDASEETEASGEEDREVSDGEENEVSESENGGLEDALEEVVKMAAVVGVNKKTKKQTSTVDDKLKL